MNIIGKLVPLSGVVCLLALSGCGQKEPAKGLPPRPVHTLVTPEPTASNTRAFSGQLRTAEGVNLAFEVSGRVTKVFAVQGKSYTAGAVLARLDDSDYLNGLEDARANLTRAEQELRRLQRLFESGNASQSQLDGSIATERSARANFNQSSKRVADTELRMPYAGAIAEVSIEAQQVITAGQPAMTVQGEGPMEFIFGVPTSIVGELKPGMPLSILLGDAGDIPYAATIAEISPVLENNVTYGVIAAMNINDPVLRAGMDGEARIKLANANGGAIEIPLASVLAATDGQNFIWIAEPISGGSTATVRRREVTVGALAAANNVTVLSGLEPGERVIIRGVHRVEIGQIVDLLTD